MKTDFSIETEWVSYHLFYQGSRDLLLSQLVLPVIRELWDGRCVIRFFFIRYSLGGPHIRLRLLCTPDCRQSVNKALRHAAAEFFRRWPSETRLDDDEIRRQNRRFSVSDADCDVDAAYPNNSILELPFQPEMERYGGPGLIACSLDYFCISSAYILRLLEERDDEPRPRRLFRAMQALLCQILGFAGGGEDLFRLASYAAMGGRQGRSLLIERADQEFERRPEDYVGLVHEVIENQIVDSILKDAARALERQIQGVAGPAWWRIVGSQLHMTANRIGLMGAEEVYIGHILRRALEATAEASCGLLQPLHHLAADHGSSEDRELQAWVMACLTPSTLFTHEEGRDE